MLYVGLFLCVRVAGFCCLCLLMMLVFDSFAFNWLIIVVVLFGCALFVVVGVGRFVLGLVIVI